MASMPRKKKILIESEFIREIQNSYILKNILNGKIRKINCNKFRFWKLIININRYIFLLLNIFIAKWMMFQIIENILNKNVFSILIGGKMYYKLHSYQLFYFSNNRTINMKSSEFEIVYCISVNYRKNELFF